MYSKGISPKKKDLTIAKDEMFAMDSGNINVPYADENGHILTRSTESG